MRASTPQTGGEVPGNDLPNHADGLAQDVGEVVAADGHGLPVQLVRPARVVAQAVNDHRQVDTEAVIEGLAHVQRVQRCQLLGMRLNEVR